MIPRWTRQDEINLRNRVRRAAQLKEHKPVEPRAVPTGKAEWCVPCKSGDHSHRAVPVGPYVICRCLNCATLVIEDHDAYVVTADLP